MAKSSETEHPVNAFGWAARDASGVLSPFTFSRRATGEHDVQFKVLYCGICHSDLHMARNDWAFTRYPIVPGHEIVGIVSEVGSKVDKFKVGDKVGVGRLTESCRQCEQCSNDLENYCTEQILSGETIPHGGYSNLMVINQHLIIRWPENLLMDIGAPLLCAGISTYSPLRYFGLDKPGLKVGIVGLGGLGHVAVKFAKAFGTRVTAISTSLAKKKEATEKLGADEFLDSRDSEDMEAAVGSLDGIIDTVPATHPLVPLISLLKPHGKLILVGAPDKPVELPVFPLITGRKMIAGSAIGGLKEMQEMVDFAAQNNILPDVEIIPIHYVNTAMERLLKSDVKYRFVIDVAGSMKED